MTMLTCGWVVIIISFIVSMVNSAECDNVLKGKSYWIWAKMEEKYNKYFVAASYQFDDTKNERKFTYTQNEHTISFKINKKNCAKFAKAISKPPADGVVRLQRVIGIAEQYTNTNNEALNVDTKLGFKSILIRPIQSEDKDILWVGKDYTDIHYKIYKVIDNIMGGPMWHIKEYSHQFVFTKITRLVPQTGDYHDDKEKIKNYQGIVLFGNGKHADGHSDEVAILPEMESVHIMNLHKHYIDGKTMSFCIQCEQQELISHLLHTMNPKSKLSNSKEKIVDVYSYLGDYDAKIPAMQRTWTRDPNVIKVPLKTEPNAKFRDLIKYKDDKNNELYMYHSHHSHQDAKSIDSKLNEEEFHKIEYVLIEYDRERFKDEIKNQDYGHNDMMATAYAGFDSMSTKKLILADFPNYSYPEFYGSFLLCRREHDTVPMVNPFIYHHVWFAVRNAVMVNTINAVVHKHEQECKDPTKLWITIGAKHGNPTNPAEKPEYLKEYSMEQMLLRPNKNKFTISYARDHKGNIKWNMDAQYFPYNGHKDLAYSKYVGSENNYNYYGDDEYDYHTKAGDVVGYNYYTDHIGYGTHGGLMLLLSIGMAIIVIIVIMYIYMLLCCICGAIIYEQTQRNDTKNGKNHVMFHDNSDRDHNEV